MKKPALVIMAAGMGSRYGGLKQMDPVDGEGHLIIDFSIYDAIQAGFEKIVFIIKREIEQEFKEKIGNRIEHYASVSYVYQDLKNIPEGFAVPEGRVKPWGTGHAVLSCLDTVKEPFAVINADDFYGRSAFTMMYEFLTTHEDDEKYHYAMVGYALKNTLTENGHVARGVCEVSQDQMLQQIVEHTRIEKRGDHPEYTEDDGKNWYSLSNDAVVSMNLWGFGPSILQELSRRFPAFLEQGIKENPLKCEYFLPSVVDQLLTEENADVRVLKSEDKWYGVTYREDKASVMEAIERMKQQGVYPRTLWNKE